MANATLSPRRSARADRNELRTQRFCNWANGTDTKRHRVYIVRIVKVSRAWKPKSLTAVPPQRCIQGEKQTCESKHYYYQALDKVEIYNARSQRNGWCWWAFIEEDTELRLAKEVADKMEKQFTGMQAHIHVDRDWDTNAITYRVFSIGVNFVEKQQFDIPMGEPGEPILPAIRAALRAKLDEIAGRIEEIDQTLAGVDEQPLLALVAKGGAS